MDLDNIKKLYIEKKLTNVELIQSVSEEAEQLDEISKYDKVVTYYRHLGLDPYKLRGEVGKQIRARIKESPGFKAWLRINQYESTDDNISPERNLVEIIKDMKKQDTQKKGKNCDITFFGYPDANTVNQSANTVQDQVVSDTNFLSAN
jgi:hypothetical protein